MRGKCLWHKCLNEVEDENIFCSSSCMNRCNDFFLADVNLNFLVMASKKNSKGLEKLLKTISERNALNYEDLDDYVYYMMWKYKLKSIETYEDLSRILSIDDMCESRKELL